ncbi:hypothetical protein P167DRAFT_252236 [Morchella conica CCBAS932]|uniref:Uncharacterized protein n=1 Tax=Morchella conica CCBAS932 TaxID=1392247 RepID=A0A3N4KLU7_9PEZI|nr:hypothetical protein P167DRAFT_252236 [Morchella conica CCBAS932]
MYRYVSRFMAYFLYLPVSRCSHAAEQPSTPPDGLRDICSGRYVPFLISPIYQWPDRQFLQFKLQVYRPFNIHQAAKIELPINSQNQ